MTNTDLDRIERELGQQEGDLEAELGAVRAVAVELEARAQQARALAETLASRGAEALSTRLRVVVPEVNGGALERARRAREEAITVRREAAAQLRQSLVVTRRLLAELSTRLDADEEEGRETIARLDAEAPRVKRALAPAPVPPAVDEVPGGLTIEQALTSVVMAARPEQRREQRRVKVQTSVDLHTDSNFYMAFSADVSEGGLFVATVMVQPVGTELDVDFTLPSGDRVQARGVVRWVREGSEQQPDSYPGMGIQFCEIDAATQDQIRSFVAQRDPMFYVD